MFRHERPRSKPRVSPYRAESSRPICQPHYHWRRLRAECQGSPKQRRRQACLPGLRFKHRIKVVALVVTNSGPDCNLKPAETACVSRKAAGLGRGLFIDAVLADGMLRHRHLRKVPRSSYSTPGNSRIALSLRADGKHDLRRGDDADITALRLMPKSGKSHDANRHGLSSCRHPPQPPHRKHSPASSSE
jgi:hypothetical protein